MTDRHHSGPLAGLQVLELAGIGPAPFAGMLLADLGADVVRVDRPGGPALAAVPQEQDLLGRGKRSVALDLKDRVGVATVLDLAEHADLLVEGMRPGVAERLGVGPDVCLGRNPRLVYGRMTGWGQDGPHAGVAGHDITYVAVTGALGASGPADGEPKPPLNLLGDFAGATYCVVGLLAALHESRDSGRGQVVDAAMVDSTAHLTTMFHGLLAAGAWQDRPESNLLDGGAPFYGSYRTSDGGWMAVGALEPEFYDQLTDRLGIAPDDAARTDPSSWPALRQRIAAAFAGRTRDEWTAVFAGSDACVAPVLSLREATTQPHLVARGTFVDHDGLTQPAPAPRFSSTPTALRGSPPAVGQDTDDVLTDWLRRPPATTDG
jgi:alpha-methylacyl-CoA racemase